MPKRWRLRCTTWRSEPGQKLHTPMPGALSAEQLRLCSADSGHFIGNAGGGRTRRPSGQLGDLLHRRSRREAVRKSWETNGREVKPERSWGACWSEMRCPSREGHDLLGCVMSTVLRRAGIKGLAERATDADGTAAVQMGARARIDPLTWYASYSHPYQPRPNTRQHVRLHSGPNILRPFPLDSVPVGRRAFVASSYPGRRTK
jgi:hypothetical protein